MFLVFAPISVSEHVNTRCASKRFQELALTVADIPLNNKQYSYIAYIVMARLSMNHIQAFRRRTREVDPNFVEIPRQGRLDSIVLGRGWPGPRAF